MTNIFKAGQMQALTDMLIVIDYTLDKELPYEKPTSFDKGYKESLKAIRVVVEEQIKKIHLS